MQLAMFLKPLLRVIAGIALIIAISWMPFTFKKVIQAQAQGIGGGEDETPFGGLSIAVVCTCGSIMEYVKDANTGNLLALVYKPGESKLFSNYNPFGLYLLGTYTERGKDGACKHIIEGECEEILRADGVLGTHPGTGTSK